MGYADKRKAELGITNGSKQSYAQRRRTELANNKTKPAPEPDKPKAQAKIPTKIEQKPIQSASEVGIKAQAKLPTKVEAAETKLNMITLGDPASSYRRASNPANMDPVAIQRVEQRKQDDEKRKAIAADLPDYYAKDDSPLNTLPVIKDAVRIYNDKFREEAGKLPLNDLELYKKYTSGGDAYLSLTDAEKNKAYDISQKLTNAAKDPVLKFLDRVGQKGVDTAFGTQGWATEPVYTDTGSKALNVVGDIAGAMAGYMAPTGIPGTNVLNASNQTGEALIYKLTQKIPSLANHPLISRAIQGIIEDVPMTAYTAMANEQTPVEAAQTFVEQLPFTVAGELGMYGLGKAMSGDLFSGEIKDLGRIKDTEIVPKKVAKAAGLEGEISTAVKNAAGLDDTADVKAQIAETVPIDDLDSQYAKEMQELKRLYGSGAMTDAQYEKIVKRVDDVYAEMKGASPIQSTEPVQPVQPTSVETNINTRSTNEAAQTGVQEVEGTSATATVKKPASYNVGDTVMVKSGDTIKSIEITRVGNKVIEGIDASGQKYQYDKKALSRIMTEYIPAGTDVHTNKIAPEIDSGEAGRVNIPEAVETAPASSQGQTGISAYKEGDKIAINDNGTIKTAEIIEMDGDTVIVESDGVPRQYSRSKLDSMIADNQAPKAEPIGTESAVPEQYKGAEPGDIDYKPVKVGMQTQVVNAPKTDAPKFEFSDPELEQIHKQNKGIKEATLTEKIKQGISDAVNMFTRPIGTLPYTKENAELYKDLIRLPKLRSIASDDAIRTIDTILKPLKKDRNAFDIFERKVFLDDLLEEAKLGNALPNKWTPDKVQLELDRLDNVMPDSVRDAITKRGQMWDTLKDQYIKAMKDIGIDMSDKFTRDNYFRHQVLEYMDAKNSLSGTGRKLKSPTGRGFTRARTGEYAGNINTDYLQAEFEVMAQMKHDTEVSKIIKNIDENYNIAKTVKVNAKADGIEDWHKAIPDGYTTWQPREGNAFYMSQPLGAEVVENALAMRNIKLDKIKDKNLKVAIEDIMNDLADQTAVLAVGGKRSEWVVKEEVAETLNNLTKTKTTNWLSRTSKKVMNAWKQWVLTLNPKSVVKYNIRNFTGDFDAVLAGNPGTIKKIPKASKELFDAMQNGKFTPELKSWYDRGGYQSLLYPQEISQVNKLEPFEKFRDLTLAEKITKPLKSYAEFTQSATNYREAINRYAAYLDYLDQLKKGELKNYGASRPEIVDGIKGIEDKAFKLSNDLLGAYDEVSQAGQVIRNHLIPFYSWMEVNMKRYKNLFKNAFTNDEVAKNAGLSAGLVAKLGLKTTQKLAGIFAMTGALAAWNQLKYGDLEETLPEDVRARPHIILGQDKDGNTLYFSRMGSLNDFLEWFGLDTASQDVKDIINGKITVEEFLVNMPKSALNKITGGISPAYKTTAELLTGQKLYPDVLNPQPIRDKAQYAAQSFGLRDEYDLIAGKPSRPYFNSLDKAILYKADPKESAYYSILNEKKRYKEKKGEESNLFFYTKKSNALYNYKLALRYGDEQAQEKYLKQYESYGGNPAQTIESVLTMSPYYGIKKDEREAFKASLSGKDKERLELAEQYFLELLEDELTSKRPLSDGTKTMMDIYKKTGETKQFPKVVSNEMTVNGKTIKLSKEDLAEFQGRVNEAMYKRADELVAQDVFKKRSPEDQAELLSNALNNAVALERIKWKKEKYK